MRVSNLYENYYKPIKPYSLKDKKVQSLVGILIFFLRTRELHKNLRRIFTIFGLILGLLVNNDQKTIIVQNGAMPGMTQYTNQTMMTQPTKEYADVPVHPQTTTTQHPQGEAFWDHEQPKNPF